MRVVAFHRYGPPEVLEPAEREPPSPGPEEVLLRVRACGVNPLDWKIRHGMLRWVLWIDRPYVPGTDVCGEVVERGEGAERFEFGETVYGMLDPRRGGGCAELAVLREASAAVAPAGFSPVEAAALPIPGLTALQALRDLGRLEAGDRVLVNGASGGVGHLAVQIAKALGAEVTGVCSTANLEWVRELGADRVIDYTREDYKEDAAAYDVVLDAVATDSLGACSGVLAARGVYVTTLPGPRLALDMLLRPLVSRRRARLIMVKPRATDLGFLNYLAGDGRLRPAVERVYPLAETAAAHAHSETGHVRGKLVVEVEGGRGQAPRGG